MMAANIRIMTTCPRAERKNCKFQYVFYFGVNCNFLFGYFYYPCRSMAQMSYQMAKMKENQRELELKLNSAQPSSISSNSWSIFPIDKETQFDIMELKLKTEKDFRDQFVSFPISHIFLLLLLIVHILYGNSNLKCIHRKKRSCESMLDPRGRLKLPSDSS